MLFRSAVAVDEQENFDDLGVGVSVPPNLPKRAVITGQVVKIEDAYARELSVGRGLAAVVLSTATVARLLFVAIAAVLKASVGAGDGRGWRSLRKGPEFQVTPIWIRDTDGLFVEVEIHGYLSGRGLRRGDWVTVTARRQNSRHLPLRAERIDNLTIERWFTPSAPTVWTHLGGALLLQAIIGLVIVALLVPAMTAGD